MHEFKPVLENKQGIIKHRCRHIVVDLRCWTSFSLSVLTRKSFDGFIILTFSSVDMVLVSYGLKAGDVQMFIINKHF